jgi:hypothetical protein
VLHFFAWADNPEDIATAIARHLEVESISVLQIEECHPIADDEQFHEEAMPLFQ